MTAKEIAEKLVGKLEIDLSTVSTSGELVTVKHIDTTFDCVATSNRAEFTAALAELIEWVREAKR